MKNKIVKDTLALTVITLVSGLLLGLVNDITAGPIASQQAKEKEEAYKAVFADAASFETVTSGEDTDLESYLDENGFKAQNIDEVMLAKDDQGNELGYAFTVTTAEGYGGDIQFAMGVQDDGTLNGISILSISETAGLGMRATTDDFKNQFKDKNVEKFTYTKTGATSDDEIDALSGATITTNAMTNGVNAGLAAYFIYLPYGKAIRLLLSYRKHWDSLEPICFLCFFHLLPFQPRSKLRYCFFP